jgi:hypothetical protein
MVVRMAEASAPQAERKPPMTLRWMTDGRRSRSELLLVGSTSSRRFPANQIPTLHFHALLNNEEAPEVELATG